MNQGYINEFTFESFCFFGAYFFSEETKVFLLSKSGTSIVIDITLLNELQSQKPHDDLQFKLFQRGFGSLYDQKRATLPICMSNDTRPDFFMVDFTTKCNMNCVYCLRHFEDSGEIIGEDVLIDICNYIISYCKNNDIRMITFQPWGGEPLLAIDRILLSKTIFDRSDIQVRYSLQTNGLILDTNMFDILLKNNISFGVSIDGCALAHDCHRVDLSGYATHERIVTNIKKIHEFNTEHEFSTISVNSNLNLKHIGTSIDYFVNKLKIRHLKFNIVHPNGEEFDKSMLININSIPEYVNTLLDNIVMQNTNGNHCIEANISDKLLNLLAKRDGEICHTNGCLGGRKFISFGSDGSIFPCELIGSKDNLIGTIYDGFSLVENINNAIDRIPYFKEKRDVKCDTCPFYCFCRGGCYASAYSYGKAAGEIDEIECAVNRVLYPRLINLILNNPSIVPLLLSRNNLIEIGDKVRQY
jgi:uncharacterized protein